MNRCPACDTEVPADATVCPSCRESLPERTASFAPVGETTEVAVVQPPAADGPLLVVRKGPEVGERFYLDRPRLTIGRDPGADIFLNDITVSRAHATLVVSAGEVTVEDAGSLNGVYVNGVSVDRAVLRTGDQVQIGRFQMVFMSGGAE
ncbi:MAG TPA: FHA domain-containing protein [Coriobacteriia bacterium]